MNKLFEFEEDFVECLPYFSSILWNSFYKALINEFIIKSNISKKKVYYVFISHFILNFSEMRNKIKRQKDIKDLSLSL